jgi:hypothetical protein
MKREPGWAKGGTPETWCCIDCGFNTAPGNSTRAELEKAFETHRRVWQQFNGESEVYTVYTHVWRAAGMEAWGGCLCIGCLEKRLGRQLRPDDFDPDHPFNSMPGTRRRLQRRTGDQFYGLTLDPEPPKGKADPLDCVNWRSVCKGAA